MPTGRNVDLALGMKINDFLDANKRAYIEYSKTKGQIERNPVNLQVKGGADLAQMSGKIASVGNAFQSLGSEIKPVIGLLNDSTMGSKGLSQAFVGLSDVGLRVFNVVGMMKTGVNGLMASMGPAGWLILGLTAASTVFSLFAGNAEEATKRTVEFKDAIDKVKIHWEIFDLAQLRKAYEINLVKMLEAAKKNNREEYDYRKAEGEKLKKIIDEQSDFERVHRGEKTKKEIEELNKARDAEIKKIDNLRQYEFQSGRIGYLEYIGYLKSKLDGMTQNTTEEKLEYQRLYDEINQIEQDFINRSANNQDRLTADFSANINKRLGEVQKYVTKSTSTTTTETKKEVRALSPIMDNLAGIIGYSIVDQLQQGSSAAKNMGAALIKMVESFAATLATKTIIWSFFNLITQGGAGSLLGFLGFAKGGEVKGKASGGMIDRSDIARSAFTPRGEDGLIGVQIGETIINRRATQMFAPILDKLNEIGRRGYGYASGGKVTEGGIMKIGGIQDFNSLVEAIKNIQTTIKLELDSVEFYRNTFPKYEKIRDRNRVY